MTPPIPQRIEAQTFDWAVYTLAILFQPDIQLVTDLDGPADPERLGRALRLLLDAEPVLGCRFVPAPHKPYWARLKDWELDEAELLEVVRDDHPFDDGEVAFRWPLATDGLAGPQVKAICTPEAAPRVVEDLSAVPGVESILSTGLGDGAHPVEK